MQTIAVLMTCHNRREKTLACLDALFSSSPVLNTAVEVFVVDDGSTDGTSSAIKAAYPSVHVIAGDGNLYWNGGMRVAFAAAMVKGFDFYLWLNDDTIVYANALPSLLALANVEQQRQNKPAVIVGTTQDAPGGTPTYGGLRRKSVWRPLTHTLVFAQTAPASCETMNGNCVLIPNEAAKRLGNLEASFVHSMGDIDYGLRASNAGFPLMVLPGYVGLCSHNPISNTFMDARLSLSQRWSKITGEKGLPMKQRYILVRRHGGWVWPFVYVWPYIKVIFRIDLK